jgi:probable F420-dependent oxidoreductase
VTLRIGVGLFTGQVPEPSGRSFADEYRDIIELARRAEALGFDSAWVSEHHGSSDGYLPSLLPMLGALAAATDRLALGTGVVLAPLHDPVRLAEDAAVVDNLSGGRLVLGLGLGWRDEEFRMLRIPLEERAARLDETVQILRRAWTGERFSHRGAIFDYDRIRVTPAPAQPGGPPIYLGGYAKAALRRAGRLADGYITDAAEPDEVRSSLEVVERAAVEAGRDPSRIALALMQNAFPWDGDDAWGVVRDGVAHQLGAYEAWEAGADTPSSDRLAIPPMDEDELRRSTPAGAPDDVARDLAPLLDPFRDRADVHLIVRLHYPGMDVTTASRAMEAFASGVAPMLRAR